MLLEKVIVSRKTPRDGKLEVSAATASRLRALSGDFQVVAAGGEDSAHTESFECTCNKTPGDQHVHHFVVSPLLRELAEGAEVRLELDDTRGRLSIVPIEEEPLAPID